MSEGCPGCLSSHSVHHSKETIIITHRPPFYINHLGDMQGGKGCTDYELSYKVYI